MTRHDPRPDPELRDTLQRFDSPTTITPAGRQALLRRIVAGADTVFSGRRPSAAVWWEVAAGWAHALVPLAVTMALVAAGFILWASGTPPESRATSVPPRDSEVAVVSRERTTRDLLDAIVSPTSPSLPTRQPAERVGR